MNIRPIIIVQLSVLVRFRIKLETVNPLDSR